MKPVSSLLAILLFKVQSEKGERKSKGKKPCIFNVKNIIEFFVFQKNTPKYLKVMKHRVRKKQWFGKTRMGTHLCVCVRKRAREGGRINTIKQMA